MSEQVSRFQGTKKDREFLYLDEMLTRALLQLDNVDPDGCDDVRQARRTVIKDINAAIGKLEALAKDPMPEEPKEAVQEPVETPKEAPQEEKKVETMEVDQQEVKGGENCVEKSAEATPDVSTS